ncbi:glycosyltransferase family 2 protein [Anaerobium acetethylicum]|uniref:Glycosyltransferase, GT2 family n=1 Tax=Anaerobium acetethylicum TaxID=1619234 RepID=A0A1D3TQD7_9FIRM|nr:glycosyltransferase family 2 protein [Anaerobium acetethylicum]SCP95737.1 Glycosyltransferase, GT2 family [Anaerobium acetethylicum]
MEKKVSKNEYKIQWKKLFSRLSPYNIKKGLKYLSHYGFKQFAVKLTERFQPEEIPYEPWLKRHMPAEETLEKQRRKVFEKGPKISIIVPVYRTPEEFLRQMIDSVQAQTYADWELCIGDGSTFRTQEENTVKKVMDEYMEKDSRIRYMILEANRGIADNTNAAISLASGDFIALLDHDDILAPNALYEMAAAISKDHEIDVLYTDEDKVTMDLKEHFQPHLKPDFNIDLLRSNNYICHMFVVRNSLAKQIGGFRKEFDGAQDYDFIFRCTEKARKIKHIPKILYHWRVHRNSTAENPASKMYAFDAGKRAIEAHLERSGARGTVSHTPDLGFYRVRYEVQDNPLVSIIIPNKDNVEILDRCLESIRKKSTYKNYEIIIVENNSTKEETFAYYKKNDGQDNIRVVYWKEEFNYSLINNFGVSNSKGEYIILLNNDTEIITENWIEEFLGHCQRPEVGIVGAKLYYPDDTIQHAGTIIGIGGIAGHAFIGMPRAHSGYLHKASIQQDLSAVTAACLMIKRSAFKEAGGFEGRLAVAFNDVDLCLKVRKAGYLVVYTPYAELYHYESKTRGAEDTKEKVRRFQTEIEYMRCTWTEILKNGDPFYNKNLTLDKWNYSLRKN